MSSSRVGGFRASLYPTENSASTEPMAYLASDLDGTFIPLSGDADSQQALEVLGQAAAEQQIELIYVTGRHFDSVLAAIVEHALPVPSWILCDVGTSVYRRSAGSETAAATAAASANRAHAFESLPEFHRRLADIVGDVDADAVRQQIAANVPGLRLQESVKQGAHKLSYYASASELATIVTQVERYLEDRGLPYGIISSVDPFNGDGLVDVMPRGASKAFALDWWCEHRGIDPTQVVFAGDSGNDLAALTAGHRAILVSNADRALALRIQTDLTGRGWGERLYLASRPSTAGVLDGARWFGLLGETPPAAIDPAAVEASELNRCLGAVPISHRATQFCVWAPRHEQLSIQNAATAELHPLAPAAGGYHLGVIDGMTAGSRYRVQIPNGPARPDPASRFQPEGVHGPSQVVPRQFAWTDEAWQGVSRDDLIVYEMHVGTFTDGGTFASAIERLEELVQLGVTAIELMPLNQFAGRWNWGYDGVDWFAVQQSYGTPDDFRRFVDAAHRAGLAVIVDVVYNHFGPEGNYLGDFGSYVSSRHTTVWGAAPNLDDARDSREMRRFVVANAIFWLDEYHVDGLRVDAIHCIRDTSDRHWVAELSDAVRTWGQRHRRRPLLIAESNVYDPELNVPSEAGGFDFDAQWCDCFLHSVFAVVRPGEQLSNRDYRRDDLQRVLRQGFVYDGTMHRERERRDEAPRAAVKGFIYSIQNHDFVGNHPLGLRLHQLTSVDTQRAAAALLLLSPAIPMLFMGEEFCCEFPFRFFVDFSDEPLRRGVVQGRRAEYPQHDWTGSVSPVDREAFEQSRIGAAADGDLATWRWYQSLIKLRKQYRAMGLLEASAVTSQADNERGLYVLQYDKHPLRLTIAVRITADREASDPLALESCGFKGVELGEQLLDSRFPVTQRSPLLPNHAQVFFKTS